MCTAKHQCGYSEMKWKVYEMSVEQKMPVKVLYNGVGEYCVHALEAEQFLARDNIYILHLCYAVSVRLSVRLSVTEVHWRIIAILGFKFRSHFTTAMLLAVLLVGGSSRAMLASASLVFICQPTLTPHFLKSNFHDFLLDVYTVLLTKNR